MGASRDAGFENVASLDWPIESSLVSRGPTVSSTGNGQATLADHKWDGRPILLPQHLADLRKSGLSDEQIARCGFVSVRTIQRIRKVLGWPCGELGACLAIPFKNAQGKTTNYIRLKPDRPRKEKGKPIKYESPKGQASLPFFPPATLAVLSDPSRPIIITEGEKKAAKADQDGFPCIGLVGVYGWQKKRSRDENGKANGQRELVAPLATLPWKGRVVYLCYDSDLAENRNVLWAEWHLAKTLEDSGAVVKVVRLPGEPGGNGKPAKVGLDDFLVAHGAKAFAELLDAAAAPIDPSGDAQPNEEECDPHRLARIFVAQCQHPDGLTLRFWRDEWHRWDRGAYRIVPKKEAGAELTKTIKAELDRANIELRRCTATPINRPQQWPK